MKLFIVGNSLSFKDESVGVFSNRVMSKVYSFHNLFQEDT